MSESEYFGRDGNHPRIAENISVVRSVFDRALAEYGAVSSRDRRFADLARRCVIEQGNPNSIDQLVGEIRSRWAECASRENSPPFGSLGRVDAVETDNMGRIIVGFSPAEQQVVVRQFTVAADLTSDL